MSAGGIFLSIIGLVLAAAAIMAAVMGTMRTRRGLFQRAGRPAIFYLNVALLLGLAGVCWWRALQ